MFASADAALRSATPHPGSEFCFQAHGEVGVRYVRIWKSNTEGICSQLHGRPSGWPTKVPTSLCRDETFTFTFVREPLERFISAYSEIVWRIHTSKAVKRLYASCAHCYSFLNASLVGTGAEVGSFEAARARAFVDDFVGGRVHSTSCCPQTASSIDLHAVPQAAFLQAAFAGRLVCNVSRLDFVGRLESFQADWARLERVAPAGIIRPFRHHLAPRPHPQTNAASNNAWRKAMRDLLRGEDGGLPTRTRDALCHLLRHDYDCFGYARSGVCRNASSPVDLDHDRAEQGARKRCDLAETWPLQLRNCTGLLFT